MLEQDNENLIRFFSIANTSYNYATKVPVEYREELAAEFWESINGEGLE